MTPPRPVAVDTAALLDRVAALVTERYGFGTVGLALVQTLDSQGLLDWDRPVKNGRPLLHWAIAQDQVAPHLFEWALHQNPSLLDQPDASGRTLFQAIWDRYVGLWTGSADNKSTSYGSASLDLFESVLAIALECAPVHHFGATIAAREAFQRRVVALNQEKLSAAFQAACPLEVSSQQRQQLLATLTPATWATIRPTVASLDEWVEVVPGVRRQFWQWGLDRQVGALVQADPAFSAWPRARQDEFRGLLRLRTSSSRASGRPAPSKTQLMEAVADLPQQLDTLSDTGCPITWLLVRRNPGLLRELLAKPATRATFEATDSAGHGCAFYLGHVLDDPLLHKALAVHEAGPFAQAFRSVVNGRGLIAQWFADPGSQGYSPVKKRLPKCHALDDSSGAPEKERQWLSPLLHPRVWAMSEADAAQMAQRWLASGSNLSLRVDSLLPLWLSSAGSRIIDASPLGPHMPLVTAVSLVQHLVASQKASSRTGKIVLSASRQRWWDRGLPDPLYIRGLNLQPIEDHLGRLAAETQTFHPQASSMAAALLAQLRAVKAQAFEPPEQAQRRPRLRS